MALQGRRGEVEPLFAVAAVAASDDPACRARRWRATAISPPRRTRRALVAACDGCTPPLRADLALLEGDAAVRRGDYARAAGAYHDAVAGGAVLRGVVAADRLARALAPGAGLRPVFFGDANDIRLSEGVASGFFWPSPALRLTAQALAGVVEQRDVDYTRTGATIGVDRWYVRPDLELAGRAGFENYAGGAGSGALAIADASVRKYFRDTSTLTLTGRRESLLTAHDDNEIRAWNRIIDLEALGPSFAVDGGRLGLDKHLRDGADDRLYAELGIQHYEDGNVRGTGYVHYQLPLDARPGSWTVLRPNGYVEAFSDPDRPAYFSPRVHSAIGLMGHTIQEHGRVRLEAELNPQMIIGSAGDVAPGGHALVDLSVQVGPARVGVAGFGFWDGTDDYWLWRAMARVEVAFR
ncbi:MAG: hypothetical protein KIT14_19550 [bacterium]|nr:hypothetical protein [bacterium]